MPDHVSAFSSSDEDTDRIGENIVKLLSNEIRSARIFSQLLIQSGGDNKPNFILNAMSVETSIPLNTIYSEVF
jgi:acyl-CoA hydrolase